MKKGDEFLSRSSMLDQKKGQVTIFIIVAIAIVAFGAIIYFLFPQVLVNFGIGTNNPQVFLQTCLEKQVEDAVEKISLQGGSLNPENYILYQDNTIEYLCYTNQYYILCSNQQPHLKQHIENEIKEAVKEDAQGCLDSLRDSFERQGFSVGFNREEISVELLPKRISVIFGNDLTLTKGDTQRYERLSIFFNNNLYELVGIANSIVEWEARFGDAEPQAYMFYYSDLKVEKLKQSDGSTIYILTNRNSGDKFQFASRSVAWPPGFGLDGVI
jgi:hypothetical protein